MSHTRHSTLLPQRWTWLSVNRWRWAGLVVLCLPALFIVDRALHSEELLRGVRVQSVVLGGLSRSEAEVVLRGVAERIRQRQLSVRVEGRIFELSLATLGSKANLGATLQHAYKEGRTGTWGTQFVWWLQRWWTPADVHLKFASDDAVFTKELARIEGLSLTRRPQAGGIVIQGRRAVPVYSKAGKSLDPTHCLELIWRRALDPEDEIAVLPLLTVPSTVTAVQVNALAERANRLLAAPITLNAETQTPPTENGSAAARLVLNVEFLSSALKSFEDSGTGGVSLHLDPGLLGSKLQPLRERLERAPQDAQFIVKNADAVSIEPSHTGTRILDEKILEAAWIATQEGTRTGALPMNYEALPKLTTEQAQALNIRRIVGHFRTSFPCCPARVKNIERIAQLLNNTLVAPGATFSVNAVVGPRTIAAGFVAAPSIEDGEMVDTVGGGVSQFATTLYNALFHAGYDIVSRQPHSYYFPRYPMGHEATLSWPKPDLVFRNDTASGVLILTTVTKTSVSVLLFGDIEGRRVDVQVSGRRELKQPEVQLLPDPSVDPASEHVSRGGKPGWSVEVTRKVSFANGTEKQERRKVTYNPEARVVAVHPCRIPAGEPGYTGEECPLPEAEPADNTLNPAP